MADITDSGAASIERPEDLGKGDAGIVTRWLREIDLADKTERKWRKRAQEAIERYRDEQERSGVRFNILYSNVQTLAPSLYNSTAKPDVRRRFRDADPLGKLAADAMERCLMAAIDGYDFDGTMWAAVLDYLLPGRAVTRVRYVPTFSTVAPPAENGATEPTGMADLTREAADLPDDEKPYEKLTYEEVICEPVNWEDFRRGPGKKWHEVPWIAFKHKLTREEATEKFKATCPEIETIGLDFTPDDPESKDEKELEAADIFKRLVVWEVFDRDNRKVLFIAPSYRKAPLKSEDDPLKLKDFYPIPRPLLSIESADSLVPIEEFRVYKDQARELDNLTRRISRIISGLKLRGIADSTIQEIEQLFQADDNRIIPSSGATAMMQQGGLDKAIWMFPIDKAAAALIELYKQREATKQAIWELTGIADIMRGQSEAQETMGAQKIKANWGTMRLQRRQREVQRYARDLIRLKAEIIGKHFQPATIAQMSGLKLPTAEEKQTGLMAMQAQLQQMQLQAQQQAAAQAVAQAHAQAVAQQQQQLAQAQPQPGQMMQ